MVVSLWIFQQVPSEINQNGMCLIIYIGRFQPIGKYNQKPDIVITTLYRPNNNTLLIVCYVVSVPYAKNNASGWHPGNDAAADKHDRCHNVAVWFNSLRISGILTCLSHILSHIW